MDLGTTYSCIAYVDEHGKPVVVPNAEGELTTPSVVYFESPDNVVVGRTAKDVTMIHQDRVVSTIKRQMGNPDYEFEADGKAYKPEEISAFILRKMVKDAAAITGDDIKDVVITCPAYFGVTEKEATKQAGTIAGLNVLYVIPEPTAAAVAYGMEQAQAQNILVYDLGGGTFDVTLIRIATGEISVIATDGDVLLGGKDWDEDIVGYLTRAFENETGVPAQELRDDVETYQELLNDAEKIKVRLSGAKSVQQRVRFKAESATIELTREKFDEITSPRLERTVAFTEELLRGAEQRGVGKIDKLLLVGGSTYMPQIIERMTKFPFEVKQFDPNQAVAKGAALFGYRCALEELIKINIAQKTGKDVDDIDLEKISARDREDATRKVAADEGVALPGLRKLLDTTINNVSSKSFGLVVIDASGAEKVNNLVVLQDRVPRDVTRQFQTREDGQDNVELRVMQNKLPDQDVSLGDCSPAEPIGTAVLSFTRPLPKGSPIEVTFRLAPDGLLSLHGRDLTTGREIDAEFKTEGVMSASDVEQARKRASSMTVS
jgi:molecular chaperone DnaK (HSP70)